MASADCRSVSVSNLPLGISKHRLTRIFENYGTVERVITISETRASVVFYSQSSAERAVGSINFTHPPFTIDMNRILVCLTRERGQRCERINNMFNSADADCSAYVTNLSITTTPASLRSFFNDYAEVKVDPVIYGTRNGSRFSYVTFYNVLAREEACNNARGKYLNGRRLVVLPCSSRRRPVAPPIRQEQDN